MLWVATGKRATTILEGAKADAQTREDRLVAHFDEEFASIQGDGDGVDLKAEIAAVQAHVQGIDDALGGKFTEWDETLRQLPTRIAQAAGSIKGTEMKALYKEAVEGEEELETYMAETMDPADIVMAKVAAIEPDEDWARKHPLGAMLVEGGKEWLRMKMDEARGVVTMKKVGTGKSPYGY